MIPLKILVIFLLAGHIVSLVFIVRVLKRQVALMKLYIPEEVRHYRIVLFAQAASIFVANLIPMTIDTLTLFSDVNRPKFVSPLSATYAITNMAILLLQAIFIWTLYRLSALSHKK